VCVDYFIDEVVLGWAPAVTGNAAEWEAVLAEPPLSTSRIWGIWAWSAPAVAAMFKVEYTPGSLGVAWAVLFDEVVRWWSMLWS